MIEQEARGCGKKERRKMKKIVCLIPLYNEQEVLGALFLRLGALFDSLCARYDNERAFGGRWVG